MGARRQACGGRCRGGGGCCGLCPPRCGAPSGGGRPRGWPGLRTGSAWRRGAREAAEPGCWGWRRRSGARQQVGPSEGRPSRAGAGGGAAGVNLWVLLVRDTWAVALLASRLVLRPGSVMIGVLNGSRGDLSRRAGERWCRAGLPSAPGAAQAPQNGERRRLRRWVTRCQSLRRRRGAGLAGPRVAVRQHIQKAADPTALGSARRSSSVEWCPERNVAPREGINCSGQVGSHSAGRSWDCPEPWSRPWLDWDRGPRGQDICAERCRPRSPAGTGRVGGSAAPARV